MNLFTRLYKIVAITIITPFVLLWNYLYAIPQEKRIKNTLENKGWQPSNKLCKPNEWKNPQLWSHSNKGEKWITEAYRMETGKDVTIKVLTFNWNDFWDNF